MSANIVDMQPPSRRVPFYRLRLKWAELLMLDHAAATLRWRQANALQPAVCRCGEPGVARVYSPWRATGKVQPYWWRCEAHKAVSLEVPWSNGRPRSGESREGCSWRQSRIDNNIVTRCGCGTHVGEVRP